MATVEVMISGVLYDKYARTSRPVLLVGEASIAGLGVGGGPIIPPDSGIQPPDQGGQPGFPIFLPPGSVGGPGWQPPSSGGYPPSVMPPVFYPPNVPPGIQPDPPPAPGSPTTTVPGTWPVNPVTPPAYMIVNYPGVGPVYVAPPASTATRPPDSPTKK